MPKEKYGRFEAAFRAFVRIVELAGRRRIVSRRR
jgi:hypothetical protein